MKFQSLAKKLCSYLHGELSLHPRAANRGERPMLCGWR